MARALPPDRVRPRFGRRLGIPMLSRPVNERMPIPCDRAAERRTARVLHVNSGNLYGGVETILATLARLKSLCPAMEPDFALCFEGRLSEELKAAGSTAHFLGNVRISRPWTVWRARRRLRAILSRERFDLVICHMPWSMAVFGPAVRASGQRLGFWAHTFHAGQSWLERLARRTPPDVVVACSRFAEAGVDNLFPQAPREVIYPPLDLNEPADRRRSRSSVRGGLNTAEDAVVIVQVSRMEAWKGQQAHLEALARIKNLPTPWVCWMVGGAQRPEEREYLESLRKQAEILGLAERVRFLGQRSDVPVLLGAADIFCQPNLTPEPFGIVFVEALWAALPVVSFALGGALEIVDDSCGLLIPPGDVEGLAAGLGSLIEQAGLRATLGRGGPARAARLSDPATQMNALRAAALRANSGGGRA
jgi:glycosyltransferase involved in cell wall biosynthesis